MDMAQPMAKYEQQCSNAKEKTLKCASNNEV